MKITVAGFNVDFDELREVVSLLRDLKEDGLNSKGSNKYFERIDNILSCEFTPETISAAYARISRSPEEIGKLRQLARKEVRKARESNERIIFGLGHSSIAEHAVFNIDFIDVSRLCVEFLEHFRLSSFTEKSQRYVTFKRGYYVPLEFLGTKFEDEYLALVKYLFEKYEYFCNYLSEKYVKEGIKSKEAELKAKEDARYILPLSTYTQVGATLNARTLERIIQKAKGSPIFEIKEMGEKLEHELSNIAPSLIKYTVPENFHLFTEELLKREISDISGGIANFKNKGNFQLLFRDENIDEKIVAAIISKNGNLSFLDSMKMAKTLSEEKKKRIFFAIFQNLESYHALLREFEVINFEFEFIISSSCFAQLKRHRMATILYPDYDISLGVTIPPSFENFKIAGEFYNAISKVEEFYLKIREKFPFAKNYILTNSHRRRVYLKANLRELYHFSRLRSDLHAQWEIREISEKIVETLKECSKYASLLLCGKDKFLEVKKKALSELSMLF